ncbi:MAG: hypothetical protein CVU43_14680 [Chloroflexi bacterium HGW-Chloroflexi-5]|jgi:uncharacterized membrane protein|nr:MAG: hypothetical protein CVU43_14680 [Chloroflexi bacterium HGW-Chloroflexi-5]
MISLNYKAYIRKPEYFFPLIILVIGIILIIITPIGANFDEETYMARIFEMATGHVMPNSFIGAGQNYPSKLISNSYRQDVNLWPIDGPTWMAQVKDRINWQSNENDELINYKTRAVYFPTLFVIQTIIFRVLGLDLNISIVFLYYAIRLSYLTIYLFLVYLSLRIIPFGKWVLGVIAVGPMALITASSVSPDPIIFGVCFVFCAWILFLSKKPVDYISNKQLIITCVLILTVCTLKPNYIFILFLLGAIPIKGFLKKKDLIILSIITFFGIGLSISWTYLASQVYFNQLNIPNDSALRVKSLFHAPQNFILTFIQTIIRNFKIYYIEAIGTSGYGYWRLPSFVYFLYPLAIMLTFFTEKSRIKLSLKQNIIIFFTGLLNILVIFALFFVSNTPLSSPTILGISGRYFIPFVFLLLIPFWFGKCFRFIRPIISIMIGLIFFFSAITLFYDFHVICGESITTRSACKLPYYKNWGPETFISANLSKGSAINQNIIVDCQTISHIDIWPLQNNTLADQQVVLNVRTGSGDLFATSSFSTKGITPNEWYSVDISDVVGMKGSAITIEIVPADNHDLSQFSLGVFPTNEYTKGELYIKDGETGKSTTADNDLIFKYQCEKN